MRAFFVLALAALLTAPIAPVAAQESPEAAEALRLFEAGKLAFDSGRFADACHKLEASVKTHVTVGALGLLAACNEEVGRITTARRQYLETARRAAQVRDKRGAFAEERARALESQVPTLTVRGDLRAGEELRCDGEVIRPNERVELDPGKHELVLNASGAVAWRAEVTLAPSEQKSVEVERAQPTAVTRAPTLAPPTAAASVPASQPDASPGSLQRTLGWIGVGVGGAGIAAGAVLGGVVLARQSSLEEEDPGCPDACRDADAVDAYNRLRIVSGAAFIAGAVTATAGAVLLFTAPRAAPTLAAGLHTSAHGATWRLTGAF